jgi:hypothetical protein
MLFPSSCLSRLYPHTWICVAAYPSQAVVLAGASAAVLCSLCAAGTYSTGSGPVGQSPTPEASVKSYMSHQIWTRWHLCSAASSACCVLAIAQLRSCAHLAGSTTAVACSLCQAGTFWTGSGLHVVLLQCRNGSMKYQVSQTDNYLY